MREEGVNRDTLCGGRVRYSNTKLYSISCILVMVGSGYVAYAWWGMSLVTIVFIIIGLACLTPIIYTWIMARRIDKILENQIRSGGDEMEQQEAGKKKHGHKA